MTSPTVMFVRRWARYFETEPWWSIYLAIYEGPGWDWEGANVELERVLFDLARARGLDVSQVCPRCYQQVDCSWCLGEFVKNPKALDAHEVCEACRIVVEWRDEKERERQRIEKLWAEARDLAYLASLTPLERAAIEEERRAAVAACMHGLFMRDVQ